MLRLSANLGFFILLFLLSNINLFAQSVINTTPISFGYLICTGTANGSVSIDENGAVTSSGVYILKSNTPQCGTATIKAPNGSNIYVKTITISNGTLTLNGQTIAFKGRTYSVPSGSQLVVKKKTTVFNIGGEISIPSTSNSGTFSSNYTSGPNMLVTFTYSYTATP